MSGTPRKPISNGCSAPSRASRASWPVSSQSQPNARVLIYYSGHGATDGAQSETYLLPVDTESYREESAGYKLSTLYANLARLDAKSVLVLLEAEYGADHGALCAAA